jgi:hypothetical protein
VSAVAVEAFVNNAGQIEKQRVAEPFNFWLVGAAKDTDGSCRFQLVDGLCNPRDIAVVVEEEATVLADNLGNQAITCATD